jgi:hypothetical protein
MGWFEHPDVTLIVQKSIPLEPTSQEWLICSGDARILTLPTKEQIDRESYYLWVAAGRPESDGVEFWHAAVKKLKDGILVVEQRQVEYASKNTWFCPGCGIQHRRGVNVPKDFDVEYKEEWVS